MTKLNELKAAYEAATPGEWGDQDGIIWGESCVDNSDESYLVCDLAGDPISAVNEQDVQNGHFITLAHNMMPTLLEAVDLLETLRYSMSQYDDGEWFLHDGADELITKIDAFLERPK